MIPAVFRLESDKGDGVFHSQAGEAYHVYQNKPSELAQFMKEHNLELSDHDYDGVIY